MYKAVYQYTASYASYSRDILLKIIRLGTLTDVWQSYDTALSIYDTEYHTEYVWYWNMYDTARMCDHNHEEHVVTVEVKEHFYDRKYL